jgi:hypothetical protein
MLVDSSLDFLVATQSSFENLDPMRVKPWHGRLNIQDICHAVGPG